MAATPRYGSFTFQGLQSGRILPVDVYCSDVADALMNWDGGAGAGAASPDSFIPTEDLLLLDVAVVTGMADTTKLQLLRGNQPTGDMLRYDQHLTTSAYRSPIRVGFVRGTAIRALQKA